jgi:7-cyano-7-deazaguanine synthase in queuosine biosynthesis
MLVLVASLVENSTLPVPVPVRNLVFLALVLACALVLGPLAAHSSILTGSLQGS